MRRRDVRLPTYDYRSQGTYLVTLVTALRERCLARVAAESVVLLPNGEVVEAHLRMLPSWRPQVTILDHVVMPDHVHLLLRFHDAVPGGLGAVVGCLKAGITREINRSLGREGIPFWQQNYWERVVRSPAELSGFRKYFADNPRRWFSKYGAPG